MYRLMCLGGGGSKESLFWCSSSLISSPHRILAAAPPPPRVHHLLLTTCTLLVWRLCPNIVPGFFFFSLSHIKRPLTAFRWVFPCSCLSGNHLCCPAIPSPSAQKHRLAPLDQNRARIQVDLASFPSLSTMFHSGCGIFSEGWECLFPAPSWGVSHW